MKKVTMYGTMNHRCFSPEKVPQILYKSVETIFTHTDLVNDGKSSCNF